MLSLALGCGAMSCGSSGGSSSGSGGGNGTGSGGSTTTSSGGQTGTGSGGTTQTGSGGATQAGTGGKGSGGTGTTGSGGTGTTGSGGKGSGGTGTTGSGGTGTTGTGGTGTTGTGGRGGAGTGTGGTGTTGSGGTSGGAGTTGTTGSVLERNNHPSRDGLFLQPAITKAAAMAAGKAKDASFAAAFSGSMWASPLYAANGPGGKGVFIAVTTGNDVIALDETDGHVVWMKNIGSSPTANQSGSPTCGNIHPLGILSTPVIDATNRKVYVAGAIGTTSIMRHEIHAISLDDGSDASTGGWPVNVSALSAGSLTFMAANSYQNQRGALSLVNGTLYVTYGGHVGDCGAYHGWVVAVDTTASPVATGAWATGGQGEAIWAPGGTASDGNGVVVMTGNNTARVSTHADSEELIRLTGLAKADKSDTNVFYPTSWMSMDSGDYDLGSNSPIYVEVPGATPSSYFIAISKDGHFYMLDSKKFGGMGGQIKDLSVASSGMSIHNVPATYTTAAGVHVVFGTDSGAKCPTGMPSGKVIMSVLIPAGAPPEPQVVWCATLGTPVTAPIATTSDGKNDAIVWYISSGKLTGVDGDTGAVVYTSSDTCSNVRQWTSPIAVNGRIITGADSKLCSWTVH